MTNTLLDVFLYPRQFPEGNGSGGGLFVDQSFVQFKGAASFIDNEVAEEAQSGGRGAGLYSNAQVDEPMIFSGPVLFKGNRGLVSEESQDKMKSMREI